MLAPIETTYNGYRFRSRLEARWAVFYDKLGVLYEYEKQGYDLGDAGWYLPDYWLPKQKAWVEIKGRDILEYEEQQFCTLAYYSQKAVFVFAGDITPTIKAHFAHPAHHPSEAALLRLCMSWVECLGCGNIDIYSEESECHLCNGTLSGNTPRLIAAYLAARQARFEKGS